MVGLVLVMLIKPLLSLSLLYGLMSQPINCALIGSKDTGRNGVMLCKFNNSVGRCA